MLNHQPVFLLEVWISTDFTSLMCIYQYDAFSPLLPLCCKLYGVPVSSCFWTTGKSLNQCQPESGEEERHWCRGEERKRSIINLFFAPSIEKCKHQWWTMEREKTCLRPSRDYVQPMVAGDGAAVSKRDSKQTPAVKGTSVCLIDLVSSLIQVPVQPSHFVSAGVESDWRKGRAADFSFLQEKSSILFCSSVRVGFWIRSERCPPHPVWNSCSTRVI